MRLSLAGLGRRAQNTVVAQAARSTAGVLNNVLLLAGTAPVWEKVSGRQSLSAM